MINKNVDKQSQNTHVKVNIFARQELKAWSGAWIVQNSIHIAETYTKETCTELDRNFVAFLKLHKSFYCTRLYVHKYFVHDALIRIT